jgi:hypothetical protein
VQGNSERAGCVLSAGTAHKPFVARS